MIRRYGMPAGALLLALALFAPGAVWAQPDPQDAQAMVKQVTGRMLDVLESDQAKGEGAADFIEKKVDAIVAPHLDFLTMTKLAVGPRWRDASDDQKRALVTQFRELLLRTYGRSLTQYSNQKLEFLPLQPSNHPGRVKIRSLLIQPDGSKMRVDYRARYHHGKWQVYDIVADGVSLATNYRSTYSSLIREKGVDGLVAALRDKNAANETFKPKSGD